MCILLDVVVSNGCFWESHTQLLAGISPSPPPLSLLVALRTPARACVLLPAAVFITRRLLVCSANTRSPKMSKSKGAGLREQDLKTLDVATLNPLSPEVISRQATINIGAC